MTDFDNLKVWPLCPDSDPEARPIITTEDGEREVTGVVYNREDAERLVSAANFCAGYDAERLSKLETLHNVLVDLDDAEYMLQKIVDLWESGDLAIAVREAAIYLGAKHV